MEKEKQKKVKETATTTTTPVKHTLATIEASKICVKNCRCDTGDPEGVPCPYASLCRFIHYDKLPKGIAKTLLKEAYTLVLKEPKMKAAAIDHFMSDKCKDPKNKFA